MEIHKLNRYIAEDKKESISVVSKLLSTDISSVKDLISEIKDSRNKEAKLYKITKELSSLIDLYDEKNKIKLDRTQFLREYKKELSPYFSEHDLKDYKEVMSLLVDETVKYDQSNWEFIYENIKSAISEENKEINKNALYELDYERLVPKSLISLLKEDKNDMLEGGFFSFQSFTQEMLGIINEYVLLSGAQMTRMYLEQGKTKDIQIAELLKEVNAASVVEPFTFNNNGEPLFQKAKSGQLDGFILHKNKAKVLLATKDENTTIEGDSVFRHFVTGLLIKKKIEEVEPTETALNAKTQYWIDYYTNDKRVDKQIRQLKEARRKYKAENKVNLNPHDFYVHKDFVLNLKNIVEDAKNRDLKEISLPLKFENSHIYMLDRKLIQYTLKMPSKTSKNGTIKLSLEEAEKKLQMFSTVVSKQEEEKEELKDAAFNKVINSPRLQEQIYIDCQKAEMVKQSGFMSLRKMISHYNKNTKEALEELEILPYSRITGTPLDIIKKNEEVKHKIPELELEDIENLLNKAKQHNVELIYYGSVSAKKQASEYHYNEEDEIKNKEFRYGLNALAYANILSDSVKDNFRISTDAALRFVGDINLRAVTKKTKEGYDLDLDKVNNKTFTNDVLHTTFKKVFEEKGIKDDSVDFYENLFNATNVVLADIVEDFKIVEEHKKETNAEISYIDVFNTSMQERTGKEVDYDIVEIFDTIKSMTIEKTAKFIHGNSIIEAVNNKVDKLIEISSDPELLALKEKYSPQKSKKEKKRRLNKFF